MKKKLLFVLLLASLLLAACNASAAAPKPTTIPSSTPTKIVLPPTVTVGGTSTAIPATSTPLPGGRATSALWPNSPFPPVADAEKNYTRGPADAPVTFIEYGDFQCPYCSQLELFLQQVLVLNPDTVRIVYRYFPVPGHALGLITAQAAEAAANQGKFWEMHDALFANQSTWTVMDEKGFVAWATDEAKTLGLDTAKFTADILSPAVAQKIADAQAAAQALGIIGAPFVLAASAPLISSLPTATSVTPL